MKFVLDLPWGVRYPGVEYDRVNKINVFEGDRLPSALKQYVSQDFSLLRWKQDALNGRVQPPEKGKSVFQPRVHQAEAAERILEAYNDGWSGFLEADETGVGKTLSVLAGVTAIARQDSGRKKLLVVCPKNAIPQWRMTIRNYPESLRVLKPLIINYEQLNKLIKEPSSTKAKRKKTVERQKAKSGTPIINWDYVVFDEAHALKNYPKSRVSLAAATVAGLNSMYRQGVSPFVVFVTATPGSSPLNLSLMSQWLSKLVSGGRKTVTPKDWGSFLESSGFHVSKTDSGWVWVQTPFWSKKDAKAQEEVARKQKEDAVKIGRALKTKGAPFVKRSPKDIAGWPEQQYVPFPLELSASQFEAYNEAWTRFRKWLKLEGAARDPKGALVEQLRYRQKTSLLKVEQMSELIEDWVDNGKQVYVAVQFIETLDRYKELLAKKGIDAAELSGRVTGDEREAERLSFQKGLKKVVLSTVTSAISLHSGETLPDGSTATQAPRVTVIHDLRQNSEEALQTLGRAHRDGVHSAAFYPFFEKTVDEKVVESFVNKVSNSKLMLGDTDDMFREVFAKEAERS